MAGSRHGSVRLFSYGTLRQRKVQLATFGRELEGQADAMPGFSLSMIAIADPEVVATSGSASHPIVRRTGNAHDEVAGMVFWVAEAELAAADDYEVDDYERIAVTLKSGTDAFVYVDART